MVSPTHTTYRWAALPRSHRISPHLTAAHRISPQLTASHRISPHLTAAHRPSLTVSAFFSNLHPLQPTSLTRLSPVTAGPTVGGSVITIHGAGLAAFATWGASASNARCRWHALEVTNATSLSDEELVCESAPQLSFSAATEVRDPTRTPNPYLRTSPDHLHPLTPHHPPPGIPRGGSQRP